MESRDVSLDDVARAAGVSAATASRALNGRAGVRYDVRTRVALVAEGLGYRPNRAAKNLAGGRTSVIGLVLAGNELVDDIYASALVQSVAKAANEFDEGLMLILDSAHPNESIRNLLRDGLVEGVIVSAVAVGERWVEDLLDAKMPTVLVGAHPRRADVPVVDVENVLSTTALVGHLLDSGCQQVATITGPLDRVDARRRLEGYHSAHAQRGLEPDPSLEYSGDFSYPSGQRVADEILDRGVDAVFAANDEMATAILHRATERGIAVPDQLSIVGFDGIARDHTSGLELTTMAQPFDAMARMAVRTLVGQIGGGDAPLEQLVEPRLVLGSTTRPLEGPAADPLPG